MLQIRKLNFSYGDMQVLWDVDLDVNDGEIVTVLGSNGAGKSTILRNVSRLVKPTSGSITLDDVDLGRLQSHQVVERGVVQVPEARRIFPEMTVVENLRMGSFVKATRKDREKNMERAGVQPVQNAGDQIVGKGARRILPFQEEENSGYFGRLGKDRKPPGPFEVFEKNDRDSLFLVEDERFYLHLYGIAHVH